jgi:transposase-like protein
MSKQRKFNPRLKFQIVLEAIRSDRAQTEVARQYNIHPQLLINWKKHFIEKGPSIFDEKRDKDNSARKTEELEKIIGQQTIEIQLLKKFLGHANSV